MVLLAGSELSALPHEPWADTSDLDQLLEEIAAVLQLTDTQYKLAETHYGAVTEWLSAERSLLAPYSPHLHPQGSMALRTTVRPWKTVEYDLDIVCRVSTTGLGPDWVYEAVYNRLASHGTYRPMLERMKRCVRINYEHEFHLDIIPAEPDLDRGNTNILIPDLVVDGAQTYRRWKASNPLGYIAWFHGRSQTREIFEKAQIDPMPARTTLAKNTVLATVVQLIKRYRDVKFRGNDAAPRSIILTTLAAHAYQGTQSTARALKEVADGMAEAVRMAHPRRIVVMNPTNPEERFCDKFTDESYEAFRDFVYQLQADVATLFQERTGLPGVRRRLDEGFGQDPVEKAFVTLGKGFARAKETGALVTTAAGIAIANPPTPPAVRVGGTSSNPVPPHRFFGK